MWHHTQQHRTQSWDSYHRTGQQRGGYSGDPIPDYRFRAYFGEGKEYRNGNQRFDVATLPITTF